MTTEDLPFYNFLGEIEYVPGYPLSFGDWSHSTGEAASAEQESLLDAIPGILGKSPTESHVRACDLNLTLEVGFEDGSSVIARKILTNNNADAELGVQKLRTEARLLHWLAKNTDIPVPRILPPVEDRSRNFFITDKLPGVMLLNIYGTLDSMAKERLVESFADIALTMFRLDVPQSIGTFAPDISTGSLDVVPRIGVQTFRARRVFDDIQQYIDFLLEMKRNSPVIGGDDGGHIEELRGHLDRVLADLFSKTSDCTSLLRCVLAHGDLNERNILVDKSGNITGIVDWEYQVLHPAVLAADYPPWLSYDGCCDPRFADPKQMLWLDSPDESRRLRDMYLQIVKSRDHEYWTALVLGAKLRSCVNWLLNVDSDPGCKRMKKWMDATFVGSCSD
ncbi:hypothetical protein LshimejAT787_1204310 [Lyophyllum shimeji]|uniref:Aminoglycoside phosphotransferase domain-containing protein n=1 Tax=Lyophyllum shimeji TaxID=47721 RepID=A0A9P3PU79_LYOSH|nr:hypothetical protein LshimejAT787_1204310 [Lyophyllum shimeji]